MTPSTALKVVEDYRGRFWYACEGRPRKSRSIPFQDRRVVLTVGHESQTGLLSFLHHEGITVLTASSRAVGIRDPHLYPAETIRLMPMCRSAASVGGWARLRDDQAQLLHGGPAKRHPVETSMEFVSGLDASALRRVMAVVLDPRWYLDGMTVSRSVYRSRLGLVPGLKPGGVAEDVLRCWAGPLGNVANNPTGCHEAGSFACRCYLEVATRTGNGSKAALRASQLFAKFLWLVWMEYLSPQTRDVFVPDRFFRPEEARAYEQHMGTHGAVP